MVYSPQEVAMTDDVTVSGLRTELMDGSLTCDCAMKPSTWHVHFNGGTVEIPVETLTAIIDYRDPRSAPRE